VQRRLFGSRIERPAQHLAVNGDDTLAGFGEAGHEALEAGAERVRVEQAEQPAERVVTGRAVLELRGAAQEVDLARGEFGHVGAVLAARQPKMAEVLCVYREVKLLKETAAAAK